MKREKKKDSEQAKHPRAAPHGSWNIKDQFKTKQNPHR